MILGKTAEFLQAACAKATVSVLRFGTSVDDPYIKSLSCKGEITIESIKDGEPVTATYSDLNNVEVNIQADADTEVTITGKVTKCYFTAYDEDEEGYVGFIDISSLNTSACVSLEELSVDYAPLDAIDVSANSKLKVLICGDMENLTSLDLAANTALQYLYCYNCTGLTSLDLAANTALQTLDCSGISGLTSLDLAANTALQYLYCGSCTGLTSIKYGASNSDVSTAIAGAITAATAADGTVYTDSQGAYYSTIADAATDKGWTIEQL